MPADPESAKKNVNLSVFALLGSGHANKRCLQNVDEIDTLTTTTTTVKDTNLIVTTLQKRLPKAVYDSIGKKTDFLMQKQTFFEVYSRVSSTLFNLLSERFQFVKFILQTLKLNSHDNTVDSHVQKRPARKPKKS